MENYIGCHDCLLLMDEMIKNNIRVDIILTDPPYNIGGTAKQVVRWNSKRLKTVKEDWDTFSKDKYFTFSYNWLSKSKEILKENGNLVVFGSQHNIYEIGYILKMLDYKIVNHITWIKRNSPPNITCRMFTHSTEQIIWAVNGDKKWTFNYEIAKQLNSGKQHRNIIDIPMTPESEKQYGRHPTQKPLELIKRLLIILSNEGDLVFDPFGGSGTTAVAAKLTNRRYICCDIKQEYVDIAIKRLENLERIAG